MMRLIRFSKWCLSHAGPDRHSQVAGTEPQGAFMRSPVRRTTLLGTALLTAAAVSLTACGGGDGGSGGNSSTVTIWSSIDAPVQAGLEKALKAKLSADGSDITIKWEQ